MAKPLGMAWHSTTDTFSPGDERTTVMRAPKAARRRRSWPVWVLPTLAFLCGGLVSAAIFTIGWRHQTQQNAAAERALAAQTARVNKLTASLATARADAAHARQMAARARASLQAAQASAATIAAQSRAARSDATSVSGTGATMATAAAKISSELKTLTTYLTTTPSSQLDAGYIESQTAYLIRQVDTCSSPMAGRWRPRPQPSTPPSAGSERLAGALAARK